MRVRTKPDTLIIADAHGILVAKSDSPKIAFTAGREKPLHIGIGAALMSLKPKRGAKAVVLSSDFFRQTTSLSKIQVAGLGESELKSSLFYEIEPFSNITGTDGLMAFKRLEESANEATLSFDVVQIAHGELNKLNSALSAQKISLLAAGGLPVGFSTATANAAELEELFSKFQDGKKLPALVEMPKKSVIPENPLPLALTVSAIACLFCAMDYLGLKSKIARLDPVVRCRQTLQAANMNIDAQISENKAKTTAILQKDADCKAAVARLARVRAAWQNVLETVAGETGEDVVLDSITTTAAFSCIMGFLTVDAQSAGDYMKRLSGKLAEIGWELLPGSITATSGGNAVRFSLRLYYREIVKN